jgi:hypothetical protein
MFALLFVLIGIFRIIPTFEYFKKQSILLKTIDEENSNQNEKNLQKKENAK